MIGRSTKKFLQSRALAWHIARHYLFSRERQALEWMVTIISIAGVAIGVATIIAVVGVMDGLRGKVIGEIISFVPHLRIYLEDKPDKDPDPALMAKLRGWPGVLAAEPILYQGAVMQLGGDQDKNPPQPQEKGNEKEKKKKKKNRMVYVRVYAFDRIGKNNLFDVQMPKGVDSFALEPGRLLINDRLTTAAKAGSDVLLVTEKTVTTALGEIPKRMRLNIQGTFKIGDEFFGEHIAFASWDDVRRLSVRRHGVDYIHIKLADPLAADGVKARLAAQLPKEYKIKSWIEDFAKMFSHMRLMKIGMLLVMLMTMVVAALNIIGTLALIVIQKTSEIGIMKAMGASDRLIERIFLAEGSLVGLIGSLIGTLLGVGFLAIIQTFNIPMPDDLFFMKRIPVEISPAMVLGVMVVSIVICTLAAFAPAHRAARLNPVEALRHE